MQFLSYAELSAEPSYMRLYANSVWILIVIICLQQRVLSISRIYNF